jgi:hypothetical protein
MANQVTTVSFVLPFASGTLDMGAIDGPLSTVLAKAQAPGSTQGQYLGRIFGEPDVVAEAVVDNGLTPVAAKIFSLTADLGITFPATTMRQIKWRWWQQTDNDRWYVEYERWVLGGATPVLLGTRRLTHAHGVIASTNVAYGLCHAAANYDSSDTAITTAVGTSDVASSSTAGSSIGDVSTNTAVLTHPVARDAGKRILGVNASSDVATASESLHASVFPGASTTTMSIYTSDLATPSADGFDDDGRLEVSFFIEPPGDCNLVMNSNAVEMQITGIASDETRHRVEMFIGRAILVPFQGS